MELQTEKVKVNFTYGSSQQFKTLLSALNTIGDEINFQVSNEAITVKQMDSTHCTMIVLELNKAAFNTWCVEEHNFCMDVANALKTVFKKVKKNESVTLSISDKDSAVWTLVERFKRVVKVPLIDYEIEKCPTPKIRFNAKVTMITKDLLDIVENAETYNDGVNVICTDESVTFRCEGDLGEFSVPLDKYGESLLSIVVQGKPESKYGISFLKPFVKALKSISDIVTLEYSSNFPLKLSVNLMCGKLSFYVAPRIDNV